MTIGYVLLIAAVVLALSTFVLDMPKTACEVGAAAGRAHAAKVYGVDKGHAAAVEVAECNTL